LGDRNLVIKAYGGSFRDGVVRALAAPFAAECDAQVTVLEGNNVDALDRSREEVAGGQPAWDITATNQTYFRRGEVENLWERIDYSWFSADDLEAVPMTMRFEHGVAAAIYSNNLVISTRAFPHQRSQPRSWADFWNVDRFPGLRALPVCDSGINPLPEIACLADGSRPDDLYPIDMARAARKLSELSPHVICWRTGAESVQLLVDGRAVAGLLGNGRAQAAIDEGAPLEIIWHDARRTFDVWYVLRGARNRAMAMRFLAFVQRPQVQANLSRITGLSPVNPKAYDQLDYDTKRKLTIHPTNFAATFANDEAWWTANREGWLSECDGSLGRRDAGDPHRAHP
jgi:putative spermidine/putrescine transport system substrate-binding protein